MPDEACAPWVRGADPDDNGAAVWPKAELDGRPKADAGWPNVVGGRPNVEGCPNDEGCPNVEDGLLNEDCGWPREDGWPKAEPSEEGWPNEVGGLPNDEVTPCVWVGIGAEVPKAGWPKGEVDC